MIKTTVKPAASLPLRAKYVRNNEEQQRKEKSARDKLIDRTILRDDEDGSRSIAHLQIGLESAWSAYFGMDLQQEQKSLELVLLHKEVQMPEGVEVKVRFT